MDLDTLKQHFVGSNILNELKWYHFEGYWQETNIINYYLKQYATTHHKNLNRSKISSHQKLLLDDAFEKKRDPPHLICFKNGVYDLKTCQFRSSSYLDYCTMCTQYIYKQGNSKLPYFLSHIFPYQEDYNHFILTMYQVFKGDRCVIYAKKHHQGQAGVSTLYQLITFMFGSYVNHYHIDYFMSRKLYTLMTNLDYLKLHFKGKLIRTKFGVLPDDKTINNISSLTSVLVEGCGNLPNSKVLNFRSQFVHQHPNPEKHIYPIESDFQMNEMFDMAQDLIIKMTDLHIIPIKMSRFKPDLCQDVIKVIYHYLFYLSL